MTIVYFFNPWDYVDELKEINHQHVSWAYGSPRTRNINPLKFLQARFGAGYKFDGLSIAVEGAALYNESSKSLDEPLAVFPCWHDDFGFDMLERYCKNPVGSDSRYYKNDSIPKRFRPVKGQPHLVVIYDFPRLGSSEMRLWYSRLIAIKKKYNVDFIMSGTNSFRNMFLGDNYGAVYNPLWTAKLNEIILPTGLKVGKIAEIKPSHLRWLRVFGYDYLQIKNSVDSRLRFNIESTLWASKYFLEDEKNRYLFRATSAPGAVDSDIPEGDELVAAAQAHSYSQPHAGIIPKRRDIQPGDAVVCNSCSFAIRCRFYREGAVCGMPGTDSDKLAKMLGSRDADRVIEGLSLIAEIQAKRVTEDLAKEEEASERFTDTDKRLKDLFDSGQKIARLVKPELNGRGVQVNVGVGIGGGGVAMVQHMTPQELVASAVRALEDKGVPREKITQEAIMGLLEGVASRRGEEILEDVIDAEVME